MLSVYDSHVGLFSESLNEKAESAVVSTIKEAAAASSSELQDNPSDGERMTAELRDIISQFMQKVCLKMTTAIVQLNAHIF